jgi:DnaJ like chaperone protein
MKQLLVIIVCLVAGYLIVSAVMSPAPGGKKGGKGADKPAGDSSRDTPGGTPGGGPGGGPGGASRDDPARPVTGDTTVTLSNWYRILGVRENSTREEIVAAYKKMISQYHPDKVAQMGPDIRAVAEAKTKQINAAYDLAMRIYR